MALTRYVYKNKQQLRCGYTTGSCAAMAAGAAARALLGGQPRQTATLQTPSGVLVEADLLEWRLTETSARCAVRKDSGDDPDVTGGMLIFATVEKTQESGITIDGGEGVGRVTRAGLDQPVEAAAINSVPRRLILREVEQACREAGYTGGLRVVISAPGGQEIATKTFNPRLGIEGGISILGTSGIVEPMSQQAITETIRLELSRLAADGRCSVVLTPGNYGSDFLQQKLAGLTPITVKCSNFLGESIDHAVRLGFGRLLLVGHIGKLVKLAGGIMNTHSSYADARLELMAVHAALCGAGQSLVAGLMDCATTDQGVELLRQHNLLEPTMQSLMGRLHFYLRQRAGAAMQTGAVVFSNIHGLLGETPGVQGFISEIAGEL